MSNVGELYKTKRGFRYVAPDLAVIEFDEEEAAHLADLIVSGLFNYWEQGDEILSDDHSSFHDPEPIEEEEY